MATDGELTTARRAASSWLFSSRSVDMIYPGTRFEDYRPHVYSADRRGSDSKNLLRGHALTDVFQRVAHMRKD